MMMSVVERMQALCCVTGIFIGMSSAQECVLAQSPACACACTLCRVVVFPTTGKVFVINEGLVLDEGILILLH